MSINSNKYVQITSGIGGAASVSARELLARIFTTNEQVPTGAVLKFSDADSVLDYFGSASEEYKRASFYFGFLSKAITSPRNINFARWAETDTSAQIFGATAAALVDLQSISAGALTVSLSGIYAAITVNFSLAASYADVATELQTKIQAEAGTFAATTVTYNALKTQFNLNTNGTADGEISVTTGTTAAAIGWGSNAIFSDGITAQTLTDVLAASTELTNDFGSIIFNYDLALTLAEILEVATWNITRNNEFQYHTTCLISDAQEHFDDLGGLAGTGVTLRDSSVTDEYPEMLPVSLLASQDFSSSSAAFNYMYTQDGRLTPTVTGTTLSNTLDAIRINYFGQTQEAGNQLNFYQRGTLMNGVKMGVYANEQWLKSDLKAELLNMFLALPIVAADDSGKAIAMSYIASTVAKAITNGAFSQGKELTNTQIQFINQISGNTTSYRDVASKGYWYDAQIEQEVNEGVTEYFISYTLIYAKRDAVDSVTGRHILI